MDKRKIFKRLATNAILGVVAMGTLVVGLFSIGYLCIAAGKFFGKGGAYSNDAAIITFFLCVGAFAGILVGGIHDEN